jgi:hypothetical protein
LTRTRRRTILKAPHKDESYFAAEPSNSAATLVSAPKAGIMIARIVHFGSDNSFRVALLKTAGYSVDECNSVSQLHAALIGLREADAVVISEGDGDAPYDAISLTRSTSMVPLILFRSRNPHYDESEFDLVVPEAIDPAKCLSDIARLISSRRQLTESAADIRQPRVASNPISLASHNRPAPRNPGIA